MRIIIIYITSGLIAFLLVCAFTQSKSKKYNYLGQTCPPDMEFIPGNDTIHSFFISKSQETNINYHIYLEWLGRVYKDYPKLLSDAKPLNNQEGLLHNYNDPMLSEQLENPAFAYYPVTGLNWLQIQDYMMWKTDRLNESISIELGYLQPHSKQNKNDNFNLEAFVSSQYTGIEGKRKFKKTLYNGHSEAQLATYFPFLFPGYRLPTEEEWDYAASIQFKNDNLHSNNKPYGYKYFPLNFLWKPNIGDKTLKYYKPESGSDESKEMTGIKSAGIYDNQFYGIYNMGNNVKEWLHDV
jgi:formylglycine-generating enzyme